MRDEAYLSAGCSLRPLIVELRHGVMQLFKAILLQKRLFAECMMHMCRCELCGSCLLTTRRVLIHGNNDLSSHELCSRVLALASLFPGTWPTRSVWADV